MMVPEPEILILMLLTAFPREGVQVQGNKAMDPNDKNLVQREVLSWE